MASKYFFSRSPPTSAMLSALSASAETPGPAAAATAAAVSPRDARRSASAANTAASGLGFGLVADRAATADSKNLLPSSASSLRSSVEMSGQVLSAAVGPFLFVFTALEPPDGFFGLGGDFTFSFFFLFPKSLTEAMLDRFLEVPLAVAGGAVSWTASAHEGVPLLAPRPPLLDNEALVDCATVEELDELPRTDSENIRVGSLEEDEEEDEDERPWVELRDAPDALPPAGAAADRTLPLVLPPVATSLVEEPRVGSPIGFVPPVCLAAVASEVFARFAVAAAPGAAGVALTLRKMTSSSESTAVRSRFLPVTCA